MMTKERREEMRKELVHCDLSPLDMSERNLVACLDDLDERDGLTPIVYPENCTTAVKIAVFSDEITVIVVGLDADGNPVDPDGTLFGPESGRDFDHFDEQAFDPSRGDVVIVDPRSSVSIV